MYDGTKYRKLEVESDDSHSRAVTNGWLAALQHHFVSAIVPPRMCPSSISCRSSATNTCSPPPDLSRWPPERTAHSRDPVHGAETADAARGDGQLGRVADYGRLVLARPLFAALKWVHALTGNWGWRSSSSPSCSSCCSIP